MGRAPCCDKANVKRGPWSPEEDEKLKNYIDKYGTGGNWIALPSKVGLKRCGKSCRLRWLNYLRPNIKHGEFSEAEDRVICNLFATIGSRWSIIASQLPGRTDNDIKNYWNTKLKKKMIMAINNNNHHFNAPSVAAAGSSYSSYSSNSNFQGHNNNNSMFMFGGEATNSCSSSEAASCNNNHHHGTFVVDLYNSNNGAETAEKQGGILWGEENSLEDYGIEEIKELIATTTATTSSATNYCNNFLFGEKKTEERVMYYY